MFTSHGLQETMTCEELNLMKAMTNFSQNMEIYCCLAHVLKTSLLSPRLKLERQRKGEQGEGSEEEKMKGYTPLCQEGVGLEGGEGKREERIKQKIVG